MTEEFDQMWNEGAWVYLGFSEGDQSVVWEEGSYPVNLGQSAALQGTWNTLESVLGQGQPVGQIQVVKEKKTTKSPDDDSRAKRRFLAQRLKGRVGGRELEIVLEEFDSMLEQEK